MKINRTVLTVSALIVGLGLAVNGYSQSFLTNGLAAYYPFNGNANDASGNGHNGTNHGGVLVPDRFGYPNQAYRFDGTNNSSTNFWIDLSQNRPLTGVQNFSICGWIKPRYIPPGEGPGAVSGADYPARGIYTHEGNVGSYVQIGVRIGVSPWTSASMRTLEFITINGYPGKPSDNFFASQPIPTNTWTAFAATYDGVTKTLFINGTVNVAEPYTFVPDWNTQFLGEGIGGNFAGQAESFDGVIDDIRIYNHALSASEVQQLYVIESGPRVDLIKAVKPSFSNLTLTTNYQLQVSGDLNTWTNQGSPFTATNTSMVYPQYWDVNNWNSLFFRLQVSP